MVGGGTGPSVCGTGGCGPGLSVTGVVTPLSSSTRVGTLTEKLHFTMRIFSDLKSTTAKAIENPS